MRSYEVLPEGYREIASIDLQKDKQLMFLVNGLSMVPMVLMLTVAGFIVPFSAFFTPDDPVGMLVRCLALLALMTVYIVLHEAIHGIFMRRYCGAKVKYGFTGMYAFAGSEGYYCKKHYTVISMAPVVILGIVLLLANFFVNEAWFYVIYLTQAMNISGAAGDLYVSWWMSKMPGDILVRDSGVAMTVFSKDGGNDGRKF